MELALFIGIILFSSILQGITGFGFALIAAPLALLFIDKNTNVVALTIISVVLNTYLLISVKQVINRKLALPLLFSSLLGLVFGVWLLKTGSINQLRILVGLTSLSFAILLYFKLVSIKHFKRATMLAGGAAGLLHTSISMSGPPVVLLLSGSNMDKNDVRKTLAVFFLSMSVVSVALLLMTNNLTRQGVAFGLYAAPACICGGFLGNKVSRLVSQKQFVSLAYLLVLLTGLVAVYSGIRA